MSSPAPDRGPAIIGFLAAGALLLGVSFFVSTRDTVPDGPPSLAVVAPVDGDTVTNPVTILFRTPADLRLDPAAGWSAGELHLHVMVDGREIMPAAADITSQDTLFAWRLPPLGTGRRSIHLTWAGRHHGNVRSDVDTLRLYLAE